jgi:hypothetical protein
MTSLTAHARLTLAAFLAIEALGCVKLDDIFDCAALCDNRPHAHTTCNGGGCVFQGCDDGYADCNGDTKDGCEVDLHSDRDHCGECERSCSSTDCILGSCWQVELLLESPAFVSAMSVDDGALDYARNQAFAMPDAGTGVGAEGGAPPADAGSGITVIERMDVATRARAILASGLDYVETLAHDTDSIYAVSHSFPSNDEEIDRVLRVSLAGGSADTLATTRVTSINLALDATNVYWGGLPASGVGYAAKAGGPMQSLPQPTLPDPAYNLSPVYDLALQGDLLYLASDGGLSTVPKAGGALTILDQSARALGLTLDSTDAYFVGVASAGGAVALRKVPLVGGESAPLWQNAGKLADSIVRRIVSDEDAIYVARLTSVVRVLKATGDATLLAGAQGCIQDIAVDADYVYWCGCGGIRRVAKQQIVP